VSQVPMDSLNKIEFEKPDLADLARHHTVADLHFHTHYSDGMNPVKAGAKRPGTLDIGI
jgi:hypothetical protein